MHANRTREIAKSHKQYAEDLNYEYLRAECLGGVYEAACMGEYIVHMHHDFQSPVAQKVKSYLEDSCGYVVTILTDTMFSVEWHS